MAIEHLHIVLLCEDYGSKLWPIAREQMPACLTPVHPGSDTTLLTASVERVRPYTDAPLHIITTDALSSIVMAELVSKAGLEPQDIDLLLEPEERGSAFSIALAAARVRREDPLAVIAVFHANQKVAVDDRWDHLLARACRAAQNDKIVIVGGQQEEPCAGNAFVRKGRALEGLQDAYEVRAVNFRAQPLIAHRAHREGALWYTGTFFVRAAVVMGDLAWAGAQGKSEDMVAAGHIAEMADFLSLLDVDAWRKDEARTLVNSLPRLSYEDALLAVSKRVVVMPTTIPISMVRTLTDLEATAKADASRNRSFGEGYLVGCRSTTVYTQNPHRKVIALGMKDAMVVDTPDALLVAQKEQLDSMDEVFALLEERGVAGLQGPARRPFPWGQALLVERAERSAIWCLDLDTEMEFASGEVVDAYGLNSPEMPTEQYVVTSGSVSIVSAEGGDEPLEMGAADAFEADAGERLRIAGTAEGGATLTLVAVWS